MITAVPVAVIIGVTGAGKTTVGRALAGRLGWPFAEGDDFHSAANVAKMYAGIPLTDEDRWPWLAAIAAWVHSRVGAGSDGVVACSALRRSYRDLLRAGGGDVRFVWLTVDRSLLAARVTKRRGHFMPASLLASQLATLEPLEPDEPGGRIDAAAPLDTVLERALALILPAQ